MSINKRAIHVRCLNNTACIVVNNRELRRDCLSFKEKIEGVMANKEGRRISERKFTGNFDVPRTETGFMMGAAHVHYYKRGPQGHTIVDLSLSEHYMAVSGDFEVTPAIPQNGWLTEAPKLTPKGYTFLGPSLSINARLNKFHNYYFRRTDWEIGDTKIYNVYGMPFKEFYKYYMHHKGKEDHIYDEFQKDKKRYPRDKNGKTNSQNQNCAAQQLIMHIGDRVVDLRQNYGEDIIPIIEIYESWYRSNQGSGSDKKWPTHASACPCKKCEIVLPYLITYRKYESGLVPWFKKAYRAAMEKFGRNWNADDRELVGLSRTS